MQLSVAIQEFDLSLAGVVASGTRKLYLRRLHSLLDFLGDVEIEQITTSDLRRWRADLSERKERWVNNPYRPPAAGGLSPWTIHSHVRIARQFFKWLIEENYLSQNPAARLELPPLPEEPPKAVAEEDLQRLLNAARDDPRNYALVCMLADTAARVGAIATLKLKDLDLENRRALVWEKGRGGRKKAQYVFFSWRTREALIEYLRVRPDNASDYLFISKRGGHLTPHAIYQLLRRLARKAGITGRFNPHAFRHGWARGALRNGADLGTVSDILGHSSVEVTKRFYARWADGELQERHDKFTWLK
ncbi:tyrosine-type recombinase/integrase [uncultured Thermanaerothrix sp.]|uniref:tyrosine-type recombinase/integrase n=1 Tax=uncultured Thermanaerothrix sp. TaxID=1195149 RepID=UPI00262BEF79|nr:tyrosine-type recombinase/integrase [uncultured Thermanaerothrix sp.]